MLFKRGVFMNRGSEWRKWDLHLHSPYTVLNNQYGRLSDGSPNVDNFINVIKQNDIAAVGLTNYFNFTDDDFCLKKRLEDEGIVVFLNLEIRLSNINNTDQLFDYHIVFDNKLENQIIKDLLVKLTANVGNTNKPFSRLTKEEIKDRANVSFESLLDTLKQESNISGHYLKGFLSRGHGNARTKKDSVYENICINSDFVIHSSCDNPSACSDRRCNHNNISMDREYWLNHSKYIRPLLQSYDAHSLDGIGTRYSWIKADLTFDGLRQILFEPEERIAFGAVSPDEKRNYLVIDNIEYKDKKLYLNSGLNAIIGGRSTGKSTLLKSIAKYQSLGNDVEYTLMDVEGYEDFSVNWRDGEEDRVRDVEYISQNYMLELAENPDKLNEIVKRILTEKNLLDKETSYRHSVDKLKQGLADRLGNIFEKISDYQNLSKPEGDLKGVNAQIDSLETQIQGILLANNFSEQEKNYFEQLDQQIIREKQDLALLENEIPRFQFLKSEHWFVKNPTIQSIKYQLSEEHRWELESLESELLSVVQTRWEAFCDDKIVEIHSQASRLESEIKEKESRDIYQKGLVIRESNTILARLYELRDQELDKQNKIIAYESSKSQLNEQIHKEVNALVKDFGKYQRLIDDLATDYNLSAGELEISLTINRVKFEDRIDYLHSRDKNNREFVSYFDDNNMNSTGFEKHLEKLFLNSTTFKLNGNKKKRDLIYDIFINEWFNYGYEIIYQGDKFEHMSQGKKAFAVLQLLLDYSNNQKPILIDQPEDSLDNRAIYNDLRKYLVKKKKERQIILVTHNPNIVVGADAENVIVANQHSTQTPNIKAIKFDYCNGSLENSKIKDLSISETLAQQGIREHIFEILEGGKEAFEKREQKYNMK